MSKTFRNNDKPHIYIDREGNTKTAQSKKELAQKRVMSRWVKYQRLAWEFKLKRNQRKSKGIKITLKPEKNVKDRSEIQRGA